MGWREWFGIETPAAAPRAVVVSAAPSGSYVRSEKREVIRSRLVEAIRKLELREDEPAQRKLSELRRSLRVLDLEVEVAALRAGDVTIEIPSSPLFVEGN